MQLKHFQQELNDIRFDAEGIAGDADEVNYRVRVQATIEPPTGLMTIPAEFDAHRKAEDMAIRAMQSMRNTLMEGHGYTVRDLGARHRDGQVVISFTVPLEKNMSVDDRVKALEVKLAEAYQQAMENDPILTAYANSRKNGQPNGTLFQRQGNGISFIGALAEPGSRTHFNMLMSVPPVDGDDDNKSQQLQRLETGRKLLIAIGNRLAEDGYDIAGPIINEAYVKLGSRASGSFSIRFKDGQNADALARDMERAYNMCLQRDPAARAQMVSPSAARSA